MYWCRSEENGKQLTAGRPNGTAIYVQESCKERRISVKACGHSGCFSFIYLQTCEGMQLENCHNYQQCLLYILSAVQMLWTLTKE